MTAFLSLAHLSKSFKREDRSTIVALDDLSLEIGSEHHLISLIGPDGAGKSTLLSIIANLLAPDRGTVTLNLSSDGHSSPIGYMSQTLGLYEDLTVGANLQLFSQLRDIDVAQLTKAHGNAQGHALGKAQGQALGLPPAARPTASQADAAATANAADSTNLAALNAYLDDLLKQVGLYNFKNYKAGSLSGGMKQKLALTCALSAKPQLLLLDEPTVGVDPLSRRELWTIIENYIKESGNYCLFSSLYLDEAEKGSLTIFIKQGKIIYRGNAASLRAQMTKQCFALHLDKSLSYQKLARALMCELSSSTTLIDICPRMGRIDLLTASGVTKEALAQDLLRLLNKIAPQVGQIPPSAYELDTRAPILEDAYINLTYHPDEAALLHQVALPAANPAATKESADTTAAKASTTPTVATANTVQTVATASAATKAEEAKRRVVIDVDNICKRFGNFTAVADSNFKVYQGEIFGLLGPNGAGKTTTFRMICALLNPTHGQILINNLVLSKAKSSVRATIGYVAQKFCLYRKLTARQNLTYFGQSYGLRGRKLQAYMDEVVQTFHLEPFLEDLSDSLPFGVQRSLSMACALIHKPNILFLDEATSGADPTSRRSFWRMISQLAAKGTTIIVTTHFMEEAEYCDRFLIQDHGQILVLGTPDEICAQKQERISIEEAFISCVLSGRQDLTASGATAGKAAERTVDSTADSTVHSTVDNTMNSTVDSAAGDAPSAGNAPGIVAPQDSRSPSSR